nr:hypothetical protein [Tanacetum cinerariifolium]
MNKSDLNDVHVNESQVIGKSLIDSHESDGEDNQVNDRFKKSKGYHAVPLPYTGNYMTPRADLSFARLDDSVFKFAISETITSVNETETSTSKTSKESLEKPKTVRPSAPIIEEWESDSEGRMEEDVTVVKEINVVEPESTVFNDEEVTMTMAQTLIKMKAEKSRILDEQMAKRLQDEEIEQAAAREKQEKEDLERAKNMAGYKIQHFKGMTYDHVRPIFEREYNNVHTFLKFDRDEEPKKKRVVKVTLLWESFKKLRAKVKVSDSESTQDTPTVEPTEMSEEDVQNMLQIVPIVVLKVEALQVKHPLII